MPRTRRQAKPEPVPEPEEESTNELEEQPEEEPPKVQWIKEEETAHAAEPPEIKEEPVEAADWIPSKMDAFEELRFKEMPPGFNDPLPPKGEAFDRAQEAADQAPNEPAEEVLDREFFLRAVQPQVNLYCISDAQVQQLGEMVVYAVSTALAFQVILRFLEL